MEETVLEQEQAIARRAQTSSREVTGALLAIISAVGFGSMAIMIKIGYAAGANSLTMLTLRFTIACILLWPFLLARRTTFRLPRKRLAGLLLMGAIGYTLISSAAYFSLVFIDAATQSLIFYTYPAMVAVLAAIVLRESLTPLRILALLMALGGCGLVAGTPAHALDWRGIVLALLAALLYAIYIISGTRITHGIAPVVSSVYVMSGAMLAFLATTTLGGAWTLEMQPAGWIASLGIAVFSTVLAIITFFAGLERLGPARTAILSTVEPVVTTLLAALILHDLIGPTQILGGLLIIAAIILLQKSKV